MQNKNKNFIIKKKMKKKKHGRLEANNIPE